MHSHTHTEAYPSPTDVAQAPDPDLALRDRQPASARRRCCARYRIVDGEIAEEPVELESLTRRGRGRRSGYNPE